MPGRAVHDQAWMVRSPRSHLFPMTRTDMVAHQMTRADGLLDFHLHRFEQGDECPLPLTGITGPVDLARTRVKGGQAMECARPLVRMLHAVGPGGAGLAGSGMVGAAAARRSAPRGSAPVHPPGGDGCRGQSARPRWHRRRRPGGVWGAATDDGAKASTDARPASAVRSRPSSPQRSPRP
jgi:hypothetical protein